MSALGVDGMILDLRNNGGGALEDAVKLTGLFIQNGPVVQVKDRHSAPQVYDDRDGEISYSGPLVVLVNSLSASASEIVAAALQDYRRAVVIGGEHTFGKGTVQVMLDLDRFLAADMKQLAPLGAIALTVQKYYRITGASTQFQGVIPDIILPDLYSYLGVGEKSQKNALGWDTVAPLSFTPWSLSLPQLAELKKAEPREAEVQRPLPGDRRKHHPLEKAARNHAGDPELEKIPGRAGIAFPAGRKVQQGAGRVPLHPGDDPRCQSPGRGGRPFE